mmetsp:Transcript_26996/g.92809  ORF Transcript_26996/g.92809 Transcript_26996/m.92809 type:complete len:230 (+) Transcript_26996:648-1337(+)
MMASGLERSVCVQNKCGSPSGRFADAPSARPRVHLKRCSTAFFAFERPLSKSALCSAKCWSTLTHLCAAPRPTKANASSGDRSTIFQQTKAAAAQTSASYECGRNAAATTCAADGDPATPSTLAHRSKSSYNWSRPRSLVRPAVTATVFGPSRLFRKTRSSTTAGWPFGSKRCCRLRRAPMPDARMHACSATSDTCWAWRSSAPARHEATWPSQAPSSSPKATSKSASA